MIYRERPILRAHQTPAMSITHCPACHHAVHVPVLTSTPQPLCTIAWPKSEHEAKTMPHHVTDWRRCVDCGHVFNATFDYANVPYSEKPNLMFNQGSTWKTVISDRQREIAALLKDGDTAVEIGYGDGSFLAGLKSTMPSLRAVGFDPNGAKRSDVPLELHAALFDPWRHLESFMPRIILARHVIEHLVDPLGFLQQFSFHASRLGLDLLIYLETPCIDNALENDRTPDFYYEHSNQFTTSSFTRLLERAGAQDAKIYHTYRREVIHAIARLGGNSAAAERAKGAQQFLAATDAAIPVIRKQLDEMHSGGKQVVVWGGTGKSASFMQRYALDAQRFSLVVDSDPDKLGTHVPGTGQKIVGKETLKGRSIDVVLIAPQWRAADIVAEMQRDGINAKQVLIEHRGKLVDFHSEDHPYR
jgi:hypothetical protein